jgi:Bacterial regulatory proteins, tetR family
MSLVHPKKMDGPARADAIQNRERILAVALAELTRSADVPLSAIAKKAGVGQATFYRHFPTREALVMGSIATRCCRSQSSPSTCSRRARPTKHCASG